MRYPPALRIRASLADVARLDAGAASLKAITPPRTLLQPGQAPEQMEKGDEMNTTMWGKTLRLGFRAWKIRRVQEGGAK